MVSYRDLILLPSAEVWRELRGLRADPPGAAEVRGARRRTFQSALEQAQQFMVAAEAVGYATRPVQLFYALSQGGRAILAASTRIANQNEKSPDSGRDAVIWRQDSHGIETCGTNVPRVADVPSVADLQLRPSRSGLMPAVAHAIDVTIPTPDQRIEMRTIWPIIPEAFAVPLPSALGSPALLLSGGDSAPRTSNGYHSMELCYVPARIHDRAISDPSSLRKFLDSYPTLRDWGFGSPAGPIAPKWSSDGGSTYTLSISRPYPKEGTPDYPKTGRELAGIEYRSSGDWWAFPSVGSNEEALHPLLVWWMTLFGLSMLARYEPAAWAVMVKIDQSAEANAIEHILDEALSVVPTLILQALRRSYS